MFINKNRKIALHQIKMLTYACNCNYITKIYVLEIILSYRHRKKS